ncbi:MAG: SPOR domain-containing protein [Gammaproteobacteria bacterium]|nr:SPOR domain-containing protein [Gammaproteobacteria bacterium]
MRHASFITYLLLAAACSSNAPQTTEQAVERTGEWFCQIAEARDEWECVQDPDLAANPEPRRLPEPPEPEPSPSEIVAAEPASVDSIIPQIPAPSQPPQSTMPKYARLAYNPDGAVGLMDLPDDFYAVQLVAVSSKEALEQFAEDHGLRGMSAARVANDDRLFYVLLLGIYETRDLAEEAITDIPPPLDELNIWIRSMGSLHQAMLAGDALAGNDEV